MRPAANPPPTLRRARPVLAAARVAVRSLVWAASLGIAFPAHARILITEVVPGVSTTATAGDTVELFNTGPGAVDLTGFVLSDLDPASAETDPTTEGSFAPPALGLPPLLPGEFAVVILTLDTGTWGFVQANYGLKIRAPLLASGSMFDSTYEQVVLFDATTPTPAALDSVVWRDDGSAPGNLADTLDDLAALTPPTAPAGFGFALGADAEWAGPDAIPDQATYGAFAIDFTGFVSVTTYGGGVLRRRSVENVFDEGAPDGPAQWEATDRTEATLGNFSGLVSAPGGFLPVRETDDFTSRTMLLRSTIHPDRRIDPAQDVDRFVEPTAPEIAAWRDVLAAAREGRWIEAFGLARPLGYEVVEFLDEATGVVRFVLWEDREPGDAGWRGAGVYAFDPAPQADRRLVLEIPHPIHDSLTLDQAAIAMRELRPRATLIAGAHRRNHTTLSLCDGTFEDGSGYRISDVAHHVVNFFHPAHEELAAFAPGTCAVQLHGFCACNYPALTHDVVVSNGVGAPAPGAPVRAIAARIDAQGFAADDGMGGDLTTAAIFDEDATSLGATNNVQGRFTNGVDPAQVCTAAATTASESFVHIEQDLDVREEPDHVVQALKEALATLKAAARGWSEYE